MHNWESWSVTAIIILFLFFPFSCLPHPGFFKERLPGAPIQAEWKHCQWGLTSAAQVVVTNDLFNSPSTSLALSSAPLNKLMADSVLPQKYWELKKAQREQTAGLKHLVEIGELVNKRGWKLDQKGLTYNGTQAKKGCALSHRSEMTKHCAPEAVTVCTVGRDRGARRNAKRATQYTGKVQRGKNHKGWNSVVPATSWDHWPQQSKEIFRDDIGKKKKQSMVGKSEILVEGFIWDLGELGPFQGCHVLPVGQRGL